MKKTNESFNTLISETDGYYFGYVPAVAIALENTSAAIMLCYLVHFEGKGHLPNGWIYKTMEAMRAGTGLTRDQQDTAIRILLKHGFIEYKRSGFHGTRHYRVDMNVVITRLMSLWENSKYYTPPKKTNRKQESGKTADIKFAEKQQPYSEETHYKNPLNNTLSEKPPKRRYSEPLEPPWQVASDDNEEEGTIMEI